MQKHNSFDKPSQLHIQPHSQPSSRASFLFKLILIALTINAFVVSISAYDLYKRWLQYEKQVIIEVENMTRSLEFSLESVFDKVDLLLKVVKGEAERQLSAEGLSKVRIDAYMAEQLKFVPEVDNLRIADEKGDIKYGVNSNSGVVASVADREYFITLRKNPSATLFISKPLFGRVSNKWIIVIARRLNKPDGTFAGVVHGNIALNYFNSKFSHFNFGKNGVVTLRDIDLGIIVRYPEAAGAGIGNKTVSKDFQTMINKGLTIGTYKNRGSIDKVPRIFSYRKVSRYPVYINVGRASGDYLSDWWHEAVVMAALLLLFFLATLVSLLLIIRSWKRSLLAAEEIQRYQEVLEQTVTERTSELQSKQELLVSEIYKKEHTAEALRQSEEKYRLIVETSNEGIFTIDVNQIITFVNSQFCTMLEYSQQEMIGKQFNYYLHTEDTGNIINEEILQNGDQLHTRECRLLTSKGNIVWAFISWAQILSCGHDSVGSCGMVINITERKKAEEALWENEVRFRMMVESIRDYAIIMLDASGHIISWNAGAEHIKGYHAEEIIGHYFACFYTPKDIEEGKPDAELARATKEGRFEVEGLRVKKDGSCFNANVAINALYDSLGELRGFVKVTRDITELKKAEEALKRYTAELERSNEELQQFAYVASHDLQEPLRMVSSFTQMLAKRYENQLDDKAKQYIDFAVDGAIRMQGLINDLLLYSRVNSQGKEPEPTNTTQVFEVAVKNLYAAITENNAEITHDELPEVCVDKLQLIQLFQNLLANAIKFHSERTPVIHVAATERDNEWCFSVRDNGIGIEQQYKEKVFIIFQRLHSRREYAGTGIGLAVCKRIVARHGGRIWFESELGKGTTFFFTLPK